MPFSILVRGRGPSLGRSGVNVPKRSWQRFFAAATIGALAASGLAVTVAGPVAAAAGSPLLNESFGGTTVADPALIGLDDACLTAATAAPPAGGSNLGPCTRTNGTPPPGAGPGWLQLTDASPSRVGSVVFDRAIPSAAGVVVEFDQAQYGGFNNADGIGFFLSDGSLSLTDSGGRGGALGYAQYYNPVTNPTVPPEPGVAGGYIGVGLDGFGNFLNDRENRGAGCPSPSPYTATIANTVALRGPGNGQNGYCVLAATAAAPGGPSTLPGSLTSPTGPGAAVRKVRVTVGSGTLPLVTIEIDFTGTGAAYQPVLSYQMTDPAPASYKLGFAGSTGTFTDVHLIRGLVVRSLEPLPLLDLVKQVDKTSPQPAAYKAGETVPYQFLVTNTGSQPLSNVVVTDPLITNVSCPRNTLGTAGTTAGSMLCTGSLTVTPQQAVTGSLTNTATARATDSDGNSLTDTDKVTVPLIVPDPQLSVTKSSDFTSDSRPGDIVTYTVTATNVSPTAYTAANPAVLSDDLSGVIDDAQYQADASANQPGTVTYAQPVLKWTGALAAAATVKLTYTVKLKAGGNRTLRNVAWGGGTTIPTCDPPNADGRDPDTGLPCAELENKLPGLTFTKTASTNVLPAPGAPVTYTVIATNQGPGDFTAAAPASFTDNMTDVLDDATINQGTITASTGTATLTGTSLKWSGALPAGASATITYTVAYTGNTDQDLVNVACVPLADLVDPTDPCRSVKIPGPLVQQRKSSNPASGTAVSPGQDVTYTLRFENTGQAAGAVSTTDNLANVLDDATLTGGPTVSSVDLTATLVGNQLNISGSVPKGAVVTVQYTVKVKPFADQTNHILGNVLGSCKQNDPTCRTDNPVKALEVTKTSDAASPVQVGDTVKYTVAVKNVGAADYTAGSPASAVDDLSGVLDDATYQNDATASSGSVSYASPTLTWTGALAVGSTATFTYTVKVTSAGNHELRNTASIPPGLCPAGGPECSDTIITLLPHVVAAKSSDPASGTAAAAGDVITYTLTYTNDGLAPGVVDSTDDLTDVLDDATITAGAIISSPNVSIAVTGNTMRVTGPIGVGETVTVTYGVTVKPDGQRRNDLVGNVLIPDDGTGSCVTPESCETSTKIGQLVYSKSVNPASGTTVAPGAALTYTLTFENVGQAPVSVNHVDDLTGVLDDAALTAGPAASDPVLSVSAVTAGQFTTTGTLQPGQKVTVTYTVSVNPDGHRADNVLANILVPAGDPLTCNDAGTNCTVNYVSVVTAKKSSDPASGTQVREGQKITYTLTFTNTSTNPGAAPAAVAWTDHMANVLDDATLAGGPTASIPALSTTMSGQQLLVTGSLASGQSATVTYTVQVKPYDQQRNHTLGNVISPTGADPVCVPGNQLCTEHTTIKPPPGLAFTGSDITDAGNAAILLLLLGGTALYVGKRRRRKSTAATGNSTE